jgi:protoporphyrinogen/coproporphyrinogen III oxidase
MSSSPHIAIVGGGIAGLSTAWYLQQRGLSYTLLEQSDRWGGKLLTERPDGFVVEGGPDSFITQKPWGVQLARELGLGERLLGTNDAARKVYVLHKGRPTPLPDGVLLIVPTKFKPFVLSGLISPLGKLRMGLDLLIPARRDEQDETLADFVTRRLGREALDKIAEPLLSGIYNAEADKQSLLATFPRFRQLEREHGSLTRGILASRRSRQAEPQPATNGKAPSMFTSFVGGVDELVQALCAQLTGDLRLHCPVTALRWLDQGGYALELADGSTLQADAVILATPAFVAADLLAELAPAAAAGLAGIRYVGTGTISLAYRRSDLPAQLPGFGVVIPASERRPINAVTVSSVKFDGRAPEGTVLLRAFFGGSRSPQSMALDDEALLRTVRDELRSLLGIDAEPLLHRIYRWPRSNPQYDVGHLERVAAIEAALPAGLYVTGSPYRGVGIPDCVKQAQDAAAAVNDYLP